MYMLLIALHKRLVMVRQPRCQALKLGWLQQTVLRCRQAIITMSIRWLKAFFGLPLADNLYAYGNPTYIYHTICTIIIHLKFYFRYRIRNATISSTCRLPRYAATAKARFVKRDNKCILLWIGIDWNSSPLRLIAYGYPVNEPGFGVIIKFKRKLQEQVAHFS